MESNASIPLRHTHTFTHTSTTTTQNNNSSSNNTIVPLSPLFPQETTIATNNSTSQLHPLTPQRQILVLISSFLTICITIGLNQSYGVFQAYYLSPEQNLLLPSELENGGKGAMLAFVGTLGAGLTWAGSIAVNPLMARLSVNGVRGLGVCGVVCMSLGLAGASWSTKIYHLLLTQGLLYGIGSSCLYFPILSTAPEYFTTHRGTCMGIILSGAGIGGLIFSPLIRYLLTSIGARWTLRTLALLNLLISLPIAITASPSRFIGRRPTHVNLALAKKIGFLLSVMAGFLQAGGNGLPLTFLAEYSSAIGYSAAFGAQLLAVSFRWVMDQKIQ